MGGSSKTINDAIKEVAEKLAHGFKMADEKGRKPKVATTFISFQGLAKTVGRDALAQLIGPMKSKTQEDDVFPLIALRGAIGDLNVVVIGLEDVLGLRGILPSFEDLAKYSAGLAQYIVLAGQSALVVFSEEMLRAPAEEVLQKAILLGAHLRPHSVGEIGGRWCILTWNQNRSRGA
jgi:hypothetical protein